MPTAKKLSKKRRAAMIERLAHDYVDAEMDDSPRATLYDFIVNGTKGLKDLTDEELIEEYKAYEDGTETVRF